MCHLSLEKILKAVVVKATKEFPPKSHNLLRLTELGKIELGHELIELFEELNRFQLSARYPDEKFTLYSIAQKRFYQTKIVKS